MNKIKFVFVFCLIFLFTFSPISFSGILVHLQVANAEEITGYQEWNQDRTISAYVTIKPGATLVIGKGVKIEFTSQWIGIKVEGNLFVKGTVKNPVTITGANLGDGSFAIEAMTGSNVVIRNTEISGGGSQAFLIGNTNIMKTAMAANYRGAVQVNGGKVDIQNTTFKNNLYAIVASSDDPYSLRVNRSRFVDNSYDVEDEGTSDFKYNWWGFSDGPQKTCYDYADTQYCYYDKNYGNFDFSNWLTQADFHDPILIVPGIMGSMDVFGKKTLDPILGTYNSLYKTFQDNGYTPEKDLFTFPYEWRDSNIENAKLLKDKIAEIKQIANWPKVDIVAHSMGGLLTREYIESADYQNDIDQLVTLGTPQNGSPEDYLTWEGGSFNRTKEGLVLGLIFKQEAKENNFSSIYDYVRNRPISSVRELLPAYDYLHDAGNSTLRAYPNNYPNNVFLDKLNHTANVAKLADVELDSIVGNLSDPKSTISKIRVVSSDDLPLWEHGYPENFSSLIGDHGLEYGKGDGTVPLESANIIMADEKIEIDAAHQSLPSKGADKAYELLTGAQPVHKIDFKKIANILSFFVFSPIDIQVIAPDGQKYGKNFETGTAYDQADGSYYTGFHTDSEFLTIPNPIAGDYKVVTQGTDAGGDYKIEVTNMAENPTDSQNVAEATTILTGSATLNVIEEKTVALPEVIFSDAEIDEIAPEAKLTFNTETQTLDIIGVDNASENVSVALSDQPIVKKSNPRAQKIKDWFSNWSNRNRNKNYTIKVATLADEAGNITNLVFAKMKDRKGYMALSLKSIAYNGAESSFGQNILQYKWQIDRNNQYRQMATHIKTEIDRLEAHFLPKKNQTWLMAKTRELADDISDDNSEIRQTKAKLPGMVVPNVVTNKGEIKINY